MKSKLKGLRRVPSRRKKKGIGPSKSRETESDQSRQRKKRTTCRNPSPAVTRMGKLSERPIEVGANDSAKRRRRKKGQKRTKKKEKNL